ncbi:hypothetical protein AJ79_01445 [Helicocarpus griseus UAMH5409]|uniref:Uncharacterized protein n=1 Tax=Helicocarpus griseus UAMH5409 TaxID=1447875 RepID=A0A2B7Y6X5_9EURO|nr:hypothetical protein AJ79_01445 [Helicocarpus griseus UAMH5409]
MDWAVVELTRDTAQHFFGVNKTSAIPSQHSPTNYGHQIAPENMAMDDFGRLEKEGYYYKVGRASGVTAGVCHGGLACCNWRGRDSELYDHAGRPITLSKDYTEEFVIMSKTKRRAEYEQHSFSDGGDSGSILIDLEGKVCGLLYGSLSGRFSSGSSTKYDYANAGLAASMPDILALIRLRTQVKDSDGEVVVPGAVLGLPT